MPSLGVDFRRLWVAYTLSAAGSAVGFGALPLIAVLVLDVSTFQVALLAALSAVAGAALALPMGDFIEQRHKRPVMIVADLVRFAVLISIPVGAALDVLTYAQLCAVGILHAAALIAFTAASGAHLKALVPAEQRTEANGRFEQTTWITLSVGPPVGGVLIGLIGATFTLALDAISFLLSAFGISRIRTPEPVPAERHGKRDLTTGWRYIWRRRGLRVLFLNSQIFGGPVMMTSPLLAVFMLRDLDMPAWQYGVVLGVPCAGGVLGAWLAPRLTRRLGLHRMLLVFGVLRAPWLLLFPLATPGVDGLIILFVAETGLLFAAGAFNPSFATYRMDATEDSHMSRVFTAWSVTSRAVQPAFMAVGGVLAGLIGLRPTFLVAGICCLVSAAVLPWRSAARAEPVPETA
ncbi:MFS transporter [Kribbella sp. DT2]|uniref:MFS transporter n=1 Tax=Kribbella sp. DT2 TaxID=3393427 RepID=UPI003CF47DDD